MWILIIILLSIILLVFIPFLIVVITLILTVKPLFWTIILTIIFSCFLNSIGYKTKGRKREERAIKLGDVTSAELYNISYITDVNGTDFSRAYYKYYVKGKKYKCHIDGIPHPPKTIQICYDRYRRNKYIDPDKNGVIDLIVILIPLVILIIMMYLYSKNYYNENLQDSYMAFVKILTLNSIYIG